MSTLDLSVEKLPMGSFPWTLEYINIEFPRAPWGVHDVFVGANRITVDDVTWYRYWSESSIRYLCLR